MNLTTKNTIRATTLLWALFIFVCCFYALYTHRTASLVHFEAGLHWLHGQNLYGWSNQGVGGFVYFPQAAILHIPFSFLPFWAAEIFWRILSIGLLAYGVYRFSQIENLSTQQWAFLLISLAVIAIGFSSARNGQSNTILTAMTLLSIVAIYAERWRSAAFFLILGLAFKPLMIVFLLLTVALYRPLRLPLVIGFILFALFPFLTQDPHYVIAQYQLDILMLRSAENFGTDLQLQHWAHFFAMLSQLQIIDVPSSIQLVTKLILAVITLLVAYFVKKKFAAPYAIVLIYTLATLYLLLFNSRTENNTYIMLAPALGFFIVEAFGTKKWWSLGFLILISLGITESYTLSRAILPPFSSWMAPLMACLFLGVVLLSLRAPAKQSSSK